MSRTMTEQVLFILRNGKISQRSLSHEKLLPVTDRGRRAVPYSSETAKQYWAEWKENNQVVDGDVYDAIFLSEHLDDFGDLPKWICANSTDMSAWTFEQLSLLAKESQFGNGICLLQGDIQRLVGTAKDDGLIKLYVKSSHAFTLPRVNETFDAYSYNDDRSQLLKVGAIFVCVVTKVESANRLCFLKSDESADLIQFKLPFPAHSHSDTNYIVSPGTKAIAEVIEMKGKNVRYKIVFPFVRLENMRMQFKDTNGVPVLRTRRRKFVTRDGLVLEIDSDLDITGTW